MTTTPSATRRYTTAALVIGTGGSGLRAAIELREVGRHPQVLLTAATKGDGVEALRTAIDAHRRALDDPGASVGVAARRASRAHARIREAVDRARAASFWDARTEVLARWVESVVGGRATVAQAASRLVEDSPPESRP